MSLRSSNPFAKIVDEVLDRIECLYTDIKDGDISGKAIDSELTNLIRMLGVNLRITSLGVSSMKEIRDFVDYVRYILRLAYDKDLITYEISKKNIQSLSKTLRSCDTLPYNFVNDLVLRLRELALNHWD